MRKFQTVMFVLVMVIASTQTFRHVYVKWVAPTGSVLDQYQTQTESEISKARTLEELLPLYAAADKEVQEYESDSNNPLIERYERDVTEPYKTKIKLQREIESREAQSRKVFQLFFYWFAGLASVTAGLLVYRRVNEWIGISAVVTGFLEMVFWTSPLHGFLPGQEFELLLNSKLALSIATVGILIWLWLMRSRYLRSQLHSDDA